MKAFKISKSNWSGEEDTIQIEPGKWFACSLGKFEMREIMDGDGYKVYGVTGSDFENMMVCKIYKMEGAVADEWLAFAGGIERSDIKPEVAAAQVLYNTI